MNAKQKRLVRELDLDSFPGELAKRRKRLGLSQTQLGEIIGKHFTVISEWETGRRVIFEPYMVHVAMLCLETLGADAVREELARRSR